MKKAVTVDSDSVSKEKLTQNTEHRIQKTNPPIPPFTKGGLGGIKGVSLVELMITLAVFSIIIGMIYSVYNAFLKTATAERKVAKTELDVVSVSWPLIKEIQSAGFGIPSSGTCTPAVTGAVASGELIIHSTAAGDDSDAGKWGYVVSTTCVLSTTNISNNSNVVVISSTNKKRLSSTPSTITTNNNYSYLNSCNSTYLNEIVYWVPYVSAGDLECYETRYSLRDYSASDTRPAMCAPDGSGATEKVKKLSRSVQHVSVSTDYQPMLDCVRDLAYRFGCINDSGNLTWHSDTACTGATGSPVLRMVKVGMIIQSGTRRDSQVDANMYLFEDLPPDPNNNSLKRPVTLTEEQRYYKWRKLEQTVTLRNLE